MSELAPVLCVFGTGSDVGKSWIATGICRLFHQAGVRVAPYKAQNMSNNAGVTLTGGEMGRAQIVQAEACRLAPHVDMNPLLLKPNTDVGAQVVLLGEVVGDMAAREYFSGGMDARRGVVLEALDRLRDEYDLVVAEGAGSCAEVNLRDRDLVNMPVALHADGPVLLVADIHRGGVFAQIVGTLEVMPEADRRLVQGVIINRFRGDATLFEDGRAWLEERTGLPILGVVPWTRAIRIESEDGLQADAVVDGPPPLDRKHLHVGVLRLPHIANFTDFEALERHGAKVHYLAEPRDLAPYDLVILPGTKNTRGDLAWMDTIGWRAPLLERAAAGGHILGICGGYQILGEAISDPSGVEGAPGDAAGLGLLPVRTTLAAHKRTSRTSGTWDGHRVAGYEIHMGRTEPTGPSTPMLQFDSRDGEPANIDDGAVHGVVAGTYLHGLFDEAGAARAYLRSIHPTAVLKTLSADQDAWRQSQYDALAEHLREHLDVGTLFGLVGLDR